MSFKSVIDKVKVVEGDITKESCDAIVNAANESLLGGGGVDGAIHRAAGSGLLKECRGLGGCATGDAKATGGYNLPSKWVIHTVGPIWRGGTQNEPQLLRSAYRRSLEEALRIGARTVCFPAISTGVYSYPPDRAAEIAVRTVLEMLAEHAEDFDEIRLVCFSKSSADLHRRVIEGYKNS